MRYILLTILGAGALGVIVLLPDRDGPMVHWMAEHGAGDVRQASAASIATWFHSHPDVAVAAKAECRGLTPSTADWGDNPDGRVCAAAASVQIFHQVPLDTTRFTP